MQVVCDVDKRIIGMHVGCPGSCADSSVFKRMSVYRHPGEFFSKDEYMGKKKDDQKKKIDSHVYQNITSGLTQDPSAIRI